MGISSFCVVWQISEFGALTRVDLYCAFCGILILYVSICGSCYRLVNRLYQTAVKRLPKPEEVLVSMDGSPIMNSNDTNNTFVLPVNKSQVCESLCRYTM